MRLPRFLIHCAVIGLTAVLALSGAAVADDDVVATVAGEDITRAEFIDALEEQAGAMILQQMIMERLLEQRKQELGVELTDEDFEEFMGRIVQQLGGPQGLQQFLMENQMTMEQLEEQIYFNMLLTELAEAEVDVTDEEIEEYFEENKEQFDVPEQIKASHILVDTREEAEELKLRVEAGEDFAELAAEHSLDPGSGPQGGDLGFFGRGMMVPEFEDTAFVMDISEMDITESDFGWHLIKVTDKTEAKEADLEDSYDHVRRQLVQERAMDPNSYMQLLQQEAELEIHDDRYDFLGF